MKLTRQKKRNLLLTFIYRVSKLILLTRKRRLKLFLDLEWIFNRLSHEESFKYYSESTHPIRINTYKTILKEVSHTDTVVDLGCKYGEIAYAIANKAKLVIGIDYDSNSIAIANKKYNKNNLSFVCDDALSYIQKNKIIFDVLILSHVIEHIDNPELFLSNYIPYFKKIYIEVPDFDSTYLNYYRNDIKTDLIYTDTDHVEEYNREELKEMLNNCKLEIVFTEYKYGLQKIWCINKIANE